MVTLKHLSQGALAFGFLTLLFAAGSAQAGTIPGDQAVVGDQTVGILTSFDALAAAGVNITGSDVRQDTFLGDVALFQVTGGRNVSNPFLLELEHQDQNLILSGTGLTVTISDLVIRLLIGSGDKLGGVLSANVSVAQGGLTSDFLGADLFSMALCQDEFTGAGAECEDADGSTLVNGFRLTITDFWSNIPIELPSDQFGVALLDVDITTVPEPSTLTLAGLGLVGLAVAGRKRHRRG